MFGSSKVSLPVIVGATEMQKKAYAYHAHDYREVLMVLSSSESGFIQPEVAKRQEKYGANEFTKIRREGLFSKIVSQLRSPLAFVLVIAFAITLALQEFLDASVIAFALSIAVVVGVLQEGKASRAFETLASSQTRTAVVIRGGKKQQIEASGLVVGDVVVLQGGMYVPADMRIMRAKALSINEAALTGEWRAVDKQVEAVSVGTPFAEQASMAWMGTFVAEGYGMGVVTAIGDNTAVGHLASQMRDVEEQLTPLQREMSKVSNLMLYVIIGLCAMIFIVGIFKGYSLNDMLLMSIAIAVASVPEGLPAAITIILAVGMETLLKRGGLVRNLLAAETLGSTTYVLTDKTGTLTEAKMSVTGIILGEGTLIQKADFTTSKHVTHFLSVALAGIDAYTDTSTSKPVVRGDSVEQAILKLGKVLHVTEANSVHRKERIDYLAFTSEQRYAAGLSEVSDGKYVLAINGAPSMLLAHARSLCTEAGEVPLTEEKMAAIKSVIETETKSGKRLVAVGYKPVEYNDIPDHKTNLIDNLVFLGIFVLADPVRKGVAEAIAGVRGAGAEVILITGDNPQTALAVAIEVGIAGVDDGVLTGTDLEGLSDEEILVALDHVRVFARVLPKQKLRIASILQQHGEIVAMTGDGINDAPALRRANIGIAIGSGTEVAKEASDLILVEDSFATIYAAIEEGRRVISNVRKIVGYLLSTSLSEAVLISVALLVGSAVPILPAQILWANIIEEGLMSVAYAFEKGEKGAMKRRPRDIHEEGVLSVDMRWFVGMVITVLGMITLSLFFYLRYLELPIETLRSVMFLNVSMDSLFMAFAFRSLTVPVWRIPLFSNLFFIGSFIISVGLLVIVISVPFFQYVLSYTPLPADLLWLAVGVSFSSLLVIELGKWLFFERTT